MTLTIRNFNTDIISNINEMVGNENEKQLFNLILDELMILYHFNNKNFKLKLTFKKKKTSYRNYMLGLYTTLFNDKSKITYHEYMMELYTTIFNNKINKNDVVISSLKLRIDKYKEINYFKIFVECWIHEIHRFDWDVIMPFDKESYYPDWTIECPINGINVHQNYTQFRIPNTDIPQAKYSEMLIPRINLIAKEIIEFSSENTDFILKEKKKIKELKENPIDTYDSDTDTISSRELRIKEYYTIFNTMLNFKFY